MAAVRIGSLASGYGGLDLGVMAVLGGQVVWHADIDPGATRVLTHHWPDVPNLGDIKTIDWAATPPIDVLTGGYPCQPFSHAGLRKGADDDRNLWPWIADAIRVLRPRLAIFENVAGHLSLGFDRVLADLAALGMDARWGVVSAADAGAPHRRKRLWIVAHPEGHPWRISDRNGATVAEDHRGPLALLKTPTSNLGSNGGSQHPDKRRAGGHGPTLADQVEHLLPTPAVNDMGAGKTLEQWDEWTSRMRAAHANGNGHGKSLSIEALRHDQFGKYAAAIARWEVALGRPAPAPTEPSGRDGAHRLSSRFVEWLMGLPAGWVTDPAIGLSRPQQLKALGNGVVPQAASLAIDTLLRMTAPSGVGDRDTVAAGGI